jgi:hypothetical protein
MKITRRVLRKIILQEMSGDRLPPHLDVEDSYDGGGAGSSGDAEVKRIVQNMVEEIEGSHGGLTFEEAAEELVRRLSALGGPELSSMNEVAEALARCCLRQMTR